MAGSDHDHLTTITTMHHDHDHDHGSELSEMQLRVRALETVLTEKGYIDPVAHRPRSSRPTRPRSARTTARASSPRPGPTPPSSRRCWKMPSTAIATIRPRQPRRRPSDRGREHAADPQHDRLHAVLLLPVGDARPAAGLVQGGAVPLARRQRSARRARRFRRHPAGRTRRSGSGIRPPRRASSCCRCGPPGTEGWSEDKLAELVTRDSMIGTGLAKAPGSVAG